MDMEQLKNKLMPIASCSSYEAASLIMEAHVKDVMTSHRYEHSVGVARLASTLCSERGIDPFKGYFIGIAHDMFKQISLDECSKMVTYFKLGAKYKKNINLAHSKLAAAFLRYEIGIKDEDVLNAISYHTTGRRGMSQLEMIAFVADAAEENRTYKFVGEIRKLLDEKRLTEACLITINGVLEFLTANHFNIDSDSIEAKKWLEENI